MLISVVQGVMVMSVIHASAGGHAGVCGVNWDHIDVCGPFYHQKTNGCARPGVPPEAILLTLAHSTSEDHVELFPWSVLLWKAMVVSLVCDTTEDHDGTGGLCYNPESCWCPWSILTLEVILKWFMLLLTIKSNERFLSPVITMAAASQWDRTLLW